MRGELAPISCDWSLYGVLMDLDFQSFYIEECFCQYKKMNTNWFYFPYALASEGGFLQLGL